MALWGAFAALAAADACTVDDNYSVDECAAGEKRACFGANDCPGVQFCIADGDGFTDCDCGVGGAAGGSSEGEAGAAGDARGGTAGTDNSSAGQAGRDETAGTAGGDRGGAGGTDPGVGGESTQGGAATGGEPTTSQGGVEPVGGAGGTAGDGSGDSGGMDAGGGGADTGGGAGEASGGVATEGGSSSGGASTGGAAAGGSSGCGQGLTECGGDCVDTDTDPDHCSECDNACPASYICSGATCMADGCGPGVLFCDDFEDGHSLLFSEISGNWVVTTDGEDGPALDGTGTGLIIAPGTAALTDVRVTVYYRLLAAPNGGGGGIVARYQSPSLYYGVVFDDDVASLVPSINGCPDEDISQFDIGSSSTFVLQVADDGGSVRIRTWFSGMLKHDCLDSSNPIPSGAVGFQASGGSGLNVSFGDIFVTEP